MTREVLHLPEPARTLLHTTFETIDGMLGEIVPEGRRWRLGGGTVLAARWMHRKSTDVDIFLPANSGIAALDPRWNPRFTNAMNALGASRVEVQDRSLKFSFPEGRIEVTQLDPTPNMPLEPAVVDGRDTTVYGNSQILTGKLYGRGKRLPPRDIFDIAVARHKDSSALRTAVNYLDSNLHAEILHTIRMDAEVYAEDAAEAIIEPAERWTHLLYEGADRAMEALELARYRRVDIRYAANRASVGLAAGDGWEAEETFASGGELALGLTRLGLERLMLRSHRSEEAFIDAADARMGTHCPG